METESIVQLINYFVNILKWFLYAIVWILRLIINILFWTIKTIPWLIFLIIIIIVIYFAFRMSRTVGSKFNKRNIHNSYKEVKQNGTRANRKD